MATITVEVPAASNQEKGQAGEVDSKIQFITDKGNDLVSVKLGETVVFVSGDEFFTAVKMLEEVYNNV